METSGNPLGISTACELVRPLGTTSLSSLYLQSPTHPTLGGLVSNGKSHRICIHIFLYCIGRIVLKTTTSCCHAPELMAICATLTSAVVKEVTLIGSRCGNIKTAIDFIKYEKTRDTYALDVCTLQSVN